MRDDLLTDSTPIAPGTWVGVVVTQNLLGALDILDSWSSLATQFVAYLPDQYPTNRLCINDTWSRKSAVVEVQVTESTTIGALATYANNVSPHISLSDIVVFGASRPSDDTWQTTCDNAGTTLAKLLSDPFKTLEELAGVTLVVVAVAALVFIGYTNYMAKKT